MSDTRQFGEKAEGYAVPVLNEREILADFLLCVGLGPRFSPTLILGRLIVGNQRPEYVAAEPERLAWIIGVALSAKMFFLMVLMNTYGPISGILCLVCPVFLFFEVAFGIRPHALFAPEAKP